MTISVFAASTTRLDILPLSDREWRISDPEKEARDGLGVVGFIEQLDRDFEVLVLGSPRDRHRFETFTDAVRFIDRVTDPNRPRVAA